MVTSRPRQRPPQRSGAARGGRVLDFRPVPSARLLAVYLILSAGLVGLAARLAWVQIVQGPQLLNRARAVQTQTIAPIGKRRTIVDRNGRMVALDEERFTVWAHPRYFNFPGDEPNSKRPPLDVAQKLAPILGLPVEALMATIGSHQTGVKLATELDPETAHRIRKLGISGLDLESYPQRIYPLGPLFANVVGFLNLERVPQAGLEQSRDSDLRRHETPRQLRRGADGTPLPDGLRAGVLYGDDLRLQLTLDSRLQQVAQLALAKQVKQWHAKRGVALVMDVRNGEMLALASTPSYDPNKFWKYPPGLFREWSVQDLYEPGSTFKPINLALALQEHVIDPHTTVNDTGSVTIGGWPIFNHDHRANGVLDLPTVLQVSSNVGMVHAMHHLKPAVYWRWLHAIGIDTIPDTDLPGAVAGELKSRTDFLTQPIEPATAAFGQGFSLTPLKLLQLHAMIANGGRLVSPHITRGLRSGDDLAAPPRSSGVQLLRPEVAHQVLEWMETVVQKGSGKGTRIPGYRIGGKTGTAQKALNGVYIPGARICSFIANLTTDNPRYVVLVVVDEPQGGNAYGSTVAVPVAKQIIEALLVLEKLPPQAAAQQLGLQTLASAQPGARSKPVLGSKPAAGPPAGPTAAAAGRPHPGRD